MDQSPFFPFAYGYSTVLAPFVEMTVFLCRMALAPSSQSVSREFVGLFLESLSVPLIYLFFLMRVLHCLNYCGLRVLKAGSVNPPTCVVALNLLI